MSLDKDDPNPNDRERTLALASTLVNGMTELKEEITKLNTKVDKKEISSKKRDGWLTVSVALDVILSIVVGILAHQATTTSRKAEAATSVAAESIRTQKLTCDAGNESRRLQRQLWNYVLEFSAENNPAQTEQEKAKNETFRTYVNTTYADRDCSNLNIIPSVAPTIAP